MPDRSGDRTIKPLQQVTISRDALGPLPDAIAHDPTAGWLDPRDWFADAPHRPLEVEIGTGKGTYLVAAAARRPNSNFLGIEWAREFFLHAADRASRHRLANVRMLHADAADFLRWRCVSAIVSVIHLYFPDPWPKPRHHKNRIIQDRFLAEVHRVLAPGGEIRIVTDHADYWRWMNEHFDRWTHAPPAPFEDRRFVHLPFEPEPEVGADELVGTNFERKYRREGRPFHAAVLRKPSAD